MKIPLIVLLGLPGAGKTTLAKAFIKKHPEFQIKQIFEDYMKGKHISPKGEALTKNFIIKAHDQLYQEAYKLDKPTILELGTNYPRYNCKKIKKLEKTKRFDLKIIFCLLEKEKCYQRLKKDFQIGHRDTPYKKELLTERYKRNYPKIYQIHCQNFNFPFFELDMETEVEENVKELEKIVYSTESKYVPSQIQ